MRSLPSVTKVIPLVAALLICACGSELPSKLVAKPFVPSTSVHKMPIRSASRVKPHAPANAQLAYYGGSVLSNVNVVVVFWGPNVDPTTQANIGGFYSAVTNSLYFDWLSEYNTATQAIGRGTLAGTVTITPSNINTALNDTDIQTELANQISAGALPASTPNTLYMTYFPPGISITQGTSSSCSAGGFCAYHGTFYSASEVFYGVVPDEGPGSGCDVGCGSDPTPFNNLTSVSSHEMIEAVTDAEVGVASGPLGPPIAWYDPNNGEIGDICNAQQGSIAGYVVQTEWSNVSNACIVSR